MFKYALFFISSWVSFACFSLSAPTNNAEPIPSLQETKNIDTVLSETVQKQITHIPLLKGQAISAASRDQIITLEGSVDNKEQAQTAVNAAKSVKGVKSVKSQLTIKLSP
jgi:osmotically-inducible protein OsmY